MATQAERRATTKAALLDAAVACLVDDGLAGFTTTEVASRAGLSNGGLFRHFPTKADLLAATVEHVFDRLRRDYDEAFRDLDEEKRTTANLLAQLWGVMSDPALGAVFDVYTAARTDPTTRATIEPVVREHVERWKALAHELLTEGRGIDADLVERAVTLSILAMQGLALNLMACPDPDAPDQLVGWLAELGDVLLPGGVR